MKIRKTAILLFALLLSGCVLPDRDPPEETEEPETIEAVTEIELELDLPLPPPNDWYVATTGEDANSCATPEEPCLTLEGAYDKSTTSDRIHIAAGTYLGTDGTGESLPTLSHSITILGAGSGATIIDANYNDDGWVIWSDTELHLEGVTIQNTGSGPGARACLETRASSQITAQDVVLQGCWKTGLLHTSTGLVQLTDVTIADTLDEDLDPDFLSAGYGIFNQGELVMIGGEIRNSASTGIRNEGPLTMTGTIIRDNQAEGIVYGYAGASQLTNVTITNNSISRLGAGMLVREGTVNMTGSTVSSNAKDAIFLSSTSILRMDTSTISDHPANALLVTENAEAELTDTTIENNGTGTDWAPVIWNAGNLTLRESRIINNFQQALNNYSSASVEIFDSEISGNSSGKPTISNVNSGYMHIERSLIANNTVTSGFFRAALSNSGLLTIINSTVSNNSHDGLSLNTGATVSFVTIAENGAAGLRTGGDGPFTIENTLVARNSGADCDANFDYYGTLLGLNIDTDGSCGFTETYTPAEIRLGGLADNGGPTFTHELLRDPDSPAIDTANGTCLSEDQREISRAGLCDVGAYETSTVVLSAPDPGFIIGTPTPEQPGNVTIITTVPCFGGPGPGYVYHSTLEQGANLNLVGAGFTGGANDAWVVARQPAVPNTNCWIPSEDVSTNIPFSEMQLITVPSLPTATPAPDDGDSRDPNDPEAPQVPQPPPPTCNFVAPCN